MLCIFNPEAGMGRFKIDAKDLLEMFEKEAREQKVELDIEMRETEVSGDAEKFSRKERDSRFDIITA